MAMSDLLKYRSMVVGTMLTNIFYTKPDGPHYFLNGIAPAYFFFTIIELDNLVRLNFAGDRINKWDDSKQIFEVTKENWNLSSRAKFKGQLISDLTIEYKKLVIHLENGVTVEHDMNYGNKLYIKHTQLVENKIISWLKKFFHGFFF